MRRKQNQRLRYDSVWLCQLNIYDDYFGYHLIIFIFIFKESDLDKKETRQVGNEVDATNEKAVDVIGHGHDINRRKEIKESDRKEIEIDKNQSEAESQNLIDNSSQMKNDLDSDTEVKDIDTEESLKKKKRNMKRNQQRIEKAKKELSKECEQDQYREDYNVWVPPNNQSGDGRTSLNDKFGY